jgi:hypothetical protein
MFAMKRVAIGFLILSVFPVANAFASSPCPALPPPPSPFANCAGNTPQIKNGQYVITDICALQTIPAGSSAKFILGQNIDASCTSSATWNGGFTPIAGFFGSLEGNGHWVDKLQISSSFAHVGLFQDVYGSVDNIALTSTNVTGVTNAWMAGGLAGYLNGGNISYAYVTGRVGSVSAAYVGAITGFVAPSSSVQNSYSGANASGLLIGGAVGGIAGALEGTLLNTLSSGFVAGGFYSGGLVGVSLGSIDNSVAAGTVLDASNLVNEYSGVGGLVGVLNGSPSTTDSYASGSVIGSSIATSTIGGLVAFDNGGSTSKTISTGTILPGSSIYATGGVIGVDSTKIGARSSYWDTTTSGIANLNQGAGSPLNDPGLKGEVTQQLQSGLPAGFSSNVWASATPASPQGGSYPFLVRYSCAFPSTAKQQDALKCNQPVQDPNCTDTGPDPYINPATGEPYPPPASDPFFCSTLPPMATAFIPALAQFSASRYLKHASGIYTMIPAGQKQLFQYFNTANAESVVEDTTKQQNKWPAAALACEGTVYAMLARLIGEIYATTPTPPIVKPDSGTQNICHVTSQLAATTPVDCLLEDSSNLVTRGTAIWWKSLRSYATLSAYSYGKYAPLADDYAESLVSSGHPLILHGSTGSAVGDHVMLVTSILTCQPSDTTCQPGDLTRLVANDPELGEQVFIDMSPGDGKAYHHAVLNATGAGKPTAYKALSGFDFTANTFAYVIWVTQTANHSRHI